jgi:hypothetical protein
LRLKIEEDGINEDQIAAKKENSLNFKEVKINVVKLLINLNKTNFTNDMDKSILVKCNQIVFFFEKDTEKIKFNLREFATGSIDTRQFVNFLSSKQVILRLRSTIINLFDVNLDINMKEKSIKIPLPRAFLDFKKQDLSCVLNYILMVIVNDNEVENCQNI